MIRFKATKQELLLIREIALRAHEMAKEIDRDYPIQDAMMDIEACHSNGCTLNLTKLASAPSFDFSHDVFGIYRHIDRETGKLGDCFVPRCAA